MLLGSLESLSNQICYLTALDLLSVVSLEVHTAIGFFIYDLLDDDHSGLLLDLEYLVLLEIAVGHQQEQEVAEVNQEEADGLDVECHRHSFCEVVHFFTALKSKNPKVN